MCTVWLGRNPAVIVGTYAAAMEILEKNAGVTSDRPLVSGPRSVFFPVILFPEETDALAPVHFSIPSRLWQGKPSVGGSEFCSSNMGRGGVGFARYCIKDFSRRVRPRTNRYRKQLRGRSCAPCSRTRTVRESCCWGVFGVKNAEATGI